MEEYTVAKKVMKNFASRNFALKNDDGVTLQTVVLASVLALVATATGIVIYNAIKNKADEVDISKGLVDEFGLAALNEKGEPASLSEVLQQTNPLVDDGILADHEGVRSGVRTGSPVVQVSAGGGRDFTGYTCALLGNGTVKCWGVNRAGQLGDGTTNDRATPIAISSIADVTQIATGWNHTCALLEGGTVKCWGRNGYGQLGDGSTTDRSTPVEVSDIDSAIQISTAEFHTCAVLASGAVKCWGRNLHGQLGDGTLFNIKTTPVPVLDIDSATQISTGSRHSCALLGNGTVKCWGNNEYGQLENGDNEASLTPVPVLEINKVIKISAGALYTCAILESGAVKCWGNNGSGQFGVESITNAIQISAGDSHTCAVLESGAVKCWGYNYFGQLGNGRTTNAIQVSAGSNHTCAVLESGTVKCWGRNVDGQLGYRIKTANFFPRQVSGITGMGKENSATQIFTGLNHTCAVLEDETVKCWGDNEYGQLGGGTGGTDGDNSFTPVDVSGIDGATPAKSAVKISTDWQHSCAVLESGTIKCWGKNEHGQLGGGTGGTDGDKSLIPVNVSNITSAIQVSVGIRHTCALLEDKTVKCWGRNNYGQLGDGSMNDSLTPVAVSGITTENGATQVSAGGDHTCAVLEDKTLECWGGNGSGELGNGSITNAIQVSAGSSHTCAVLESGTVKCWGYNYYGQLGDGTTTNNSTPVFVRGISTTDNTTQVSAGWYRSCAILEGGEVKCWGS